MAPSPSPPVRSLPRPQIKAAEAKEAAKNKPAEPKASVAQKTTPSRPAASTPRATTGGKTMGAKGRAGESWEAYLCGGCPVPDRRQAAHLFWGGRQPSRPWPPLRSRSPLLVEGYRRGTMGYRG